MVILVLLMMRIIVFIINKSLLINMIMIIKHLFVINFTFIFFKNKEFYIKIKIKVGLSVGDLNII